MSNRLRVANLTATILICAASTAFAQASPPPTPTTKILAIGTIIPGTDARLAQQILPSEMRATAQLYLDGKIDQWYSLQGRVGVAFVLNVTDAAVANELVESLPLGRAHLMRFELIPLAPLNPLRTLPGLTADRS